MIIRQIDDFLSKDECIDLIKQIDTNNQPSIVVGSYTGILHDARTSSTSNIKENQFITQKIKQKVRKEVGLHISHIENIQGQVYKKGQFFRQHHDWFNEHSYEQHCLHSGNRCWTIMIYLNEDMVGGETKFHNLNLTFTPKMGTAVVWQNMVDGIPTTDSLHEGCDVIDGSKYIITIWVREKPWNSTLDLKLYNEKYPKITPIKNKFSTKDNLPKLSETGFLLTKLSVEDLELVNTMYESVRNDKVEEIFDHKNSIILGNNNTSDIMPLDTIPELRNNLHKKLQSLHSNWCGEEIEPTYIYGIRSYNKGAKLASHYDRIETHHISSIIMVDKDLGNGSDWGLQIEDHSGNTHNIYMQPGDILFYESAVCLHGRSDEFEGEYYRNMYVHYKLKNWEYESNT